MPRTNSPQFETYKTVDIPFNLSNDYRTGDLTVARDLQVINMFFDSTSGEDNKKRLVKLKKRPGLTTTSYSLTKSVSSDTLRGSFYDPDNNQWYWAVNDKIYTVKPDSGTSVRTVQTISTSSGYVGFCSYIMNTGTRYVVFTDGTTLYYDNPATTTCTAVTAGYPTPHQPFPLFLDQYLFLIDAGTNDIYNSDVNDINSWSGSGLISAVIESDLALRLFKVKNYIICLGTSSVEYFYDAAVDAPASPLKRNESPVRGVGYITGGCQIGDTVYFVGQDKNANIGVYSVNSFKVDRVSTPVVDRTLQAFGSTSNVKGNVNLNKDGFSISVDGHNFYVIVTTQTTWAYDIDEKEWYEWRNSDGDGLAIEAAFGMYNGAQYLAIANQTYVSIMSPKIYQDFGVDFTCQYTTDNMTFDTFNWKVGHRLAISCSKHLSTVDSSLTVTYSPDDWSPDGVVGSKTINVFSNSPIAHRFGKFRNISFRFTYADNYPFFMDAASFDINVMGV